MKAAVDIDAWRCAAEISVGGVRRWERVWQWFAIQGKPDLAGGRNVLRAQMLVDRHLLGVLQEALALWSQGGARGVDDADLRLLEVTAGELLTPLPSELCVSPSLARALHDWADHGVQMHGRGEFRVHALPTRRARRREWDGFAAHLRQLADTATRVNGSLTRLVRHTDELEQLRIALSQGDTAAALHWVETKARWDGDRDLGRAVSVAQGLREQGRLGDAPDVGELTPGETWVRWGEYLRSLEPNPVLHLAARGTASEELFGADAN